MEMKLKVAIVDDSLSDLMALEQLVTKAANDSGCDIFASRFTDPRSAIEAIDTNKAENRLFFVDVMMPKLYGTELVPLMREKCGDHTLFVLMSSQHGYMKDGYSVEAFDFLCKPFSEKDVSAVISRAVKRFQACKQGVFNFYADKTNYKIDYADILAVSVVKNYATLMTTSGRYCFRSTVKQLLEAFPEQFIQISSNTIVNITRVTSISTKNVTLRRDNITLDVSKAYFGRVLEAFKSNN